MMRWNSTKTYTDDDMMRMQQEAVRRVHDFQERSRSVSFYDVPSSDMQDIPDEEKSVKAGHTFFPEDSEDQNKDNSNGNDDMEPTVIEAQSRDITPVTAPNPDPISEFFKGLNIDSETLMIMGLLFLLYNEKADTSLLIALAYLLL